MKRATYLIDEHQINPDHIDPDAKFVLERLSQAGHTAYLVGGCVRDLLLGATPKDFDIATSAKPEEVKKLFKQCLLIGKRFRLAHIRFKKKVIEVATFRAGDTESEELITHDNTWGNPQQDVIRRDFTINGLFYDIQSHQIIDYVGGYQDIEKGCIRTIGDPITRFKQDPVRMIRLVKFKARFGLEVEPETHEALYACIDEITKSSSARVLEEILRMLEGGHAQRFFELMTETGLLAPIFPDLYKFLKGRSKKRIYDYLSTVDTLIGENGKRIHRDLLFCTLIYPRVEWSAQKLVKETGDPLLPQDIYQICARQLELTTGSFQHFPKKMRSRILHILQIQFKLTPLIEKQRSGRSRFMKSEEFPYALNFLKLRCAHSPKWSKQLDYWLKRYQHLKETEPDFFPPPSEDHRRKHSHRQRPRKNFRKKRPLNPPSTSSEDY